MTARVTVPLAERIRLEGTTTSVVAAAAGITWAREEWRSRWAATGALLTSGERRPKSYLE